MDTDPFELPREAYEAELAMDRTLERLISLSPEPVEPVEPVEAKSNLVHGIELVQPPG
jgi:hypothetical protein